MVCAVVVCALAFASARSGGAAPTWSRATAAPIVNSNTQPDNAPAAIWHAAIARSVVSVAAHQAPDALTIFQGTLSVPPRRHRFAQRTWAFRRPHDPPHLHTFALLI